METRVAFADLAAWPRRLRESGHPDASPLLIVDLDDADWSLTQRVASTLESTSGVVVGTSAICLPAEAGPVCDRMTTVLAPGGPGVTWVPADQGALDRIEQVVSSAPHAAASLAQLLRLNAGLRPEDGVAMESITYSMLLASSEFASWRGRRPARTVPERDLPVRLEREGDVLRLVLNRPERRNAFSRSVRDALLEGIDVADHDTSITRVELSGAGPAFCSGGDLDEFGTARDAAEAHLIRMETHVGLALHRLADRLEVRLHGACVGAGIELPAFAARVLAREGAWFQLPELTMGLVPGAGGTVSISRRIGRWRTAYLALTGDRLDLETAISWGLVDGRG